VKETKFEFQLLIEGIDLPEQEVAQYIVNHFEGEALLAVGDKSLMRVHFHTDKPWEVLEYCASIGDVFDIQIDNTQRRNKGLEI
jgi:dihydroxyacetone kinase-like predicted kinase